MPLLGMLGLLQPPQGPVHLSGTEGSPVHVQHVSFDPDDALVAFSVIVKDGTGARLKGHIMSVAYDYADAGDTDFISMSPDTDWIIPHNFWVSHYINATLVAGNAPIAGALDLWQILVPDNPSPFGNRSWTWARTAIGMTTGTLKLEISTDPAGINIVATGYYKATVIVT